MYDELEVFSTVVILHFRGHLLRLSAIVTKGTVEKDCSVDEIYEPQTPKLEERVNDRLEQENEMITCIWNITRRLKESFYK